MEDGFAGIWRGRVVIGNIGVVPALLFGILYLMLLYAPLLLTSVIWGSICPVFLIFAGGAYFVLSFTNHKEDEKLDDDPFKRGISNYSSWRWLDGTLAGISFFFGYVCVILFSEGRDILSHSYH